MNLSYNHISDITPLAKLENLTLCDISFNKIQDLSPLSSLKKLEYLNIEQNQVSDLSPFGFNCQKFFSLTSDQIRLQMSRP